MSLLPRIAVLLLVVGLAPLAVAGNAPQALDRIFVDYEQEFLALNPHDATLRGDRRYNAVLAARISDGFLAAERALTERYLAALDTIDTAALGTTGQNSAATFRFNLELARERHASGFAAKQALMPDSSHD